MRPIGISLLIASLLAVSLSSMVVAKSSIGCTNSFHAVGLNTGYTGGGAPATGVDPWWDMSLEGIAAEGVTLAELFATFGVADIDEFYELVLTGILPVDKNGNGIICAKAFPPHQQGTPLYYFLANDDKAG